jgi:uncharacterized protein (TIGR02996 family)
LESGRPHAAANADLHIRSAIHRHPDDWRSVHPAALEAVDELRKSGVEQADLEQSIQRHIARTTRQRRMPTTAVKQAIALDNFRSEAIEPKVGGDPERYAALPAKYRTPALSDFIQAVRNVRSSGQQVRRKIAEDQTKKLKLELKSLRDAVSDAPHTASADTLQQIVHDGDYDRVRAASALYGLQVNSPSLLLFHIDDEGGSLLHKFDVRGSAEKLRRRLDAVGLTSRTLLPTDTGWSCVVYDADGRLHPTVQKAAMESGSDLQTSRGHAEVIGGSDDAEGNKTARKSYRSIIRSYERNQSSQQSSPAVQYQREPNTDSGAAMKYGDESERKAFEDSIDANPLESTNHLVYADWLDEAGEHDEAAFRRSIGEWHKRRFDAGYTELPEDGRWTADVVDSVDSPYSGRVTLPKGIRTINLPSRDERKGEWFHSYASMQWPSYRDMEHDFRHSFLEGRKKGGE